MLTLESRQLRAAVLPTVGGSIASLEMITAEGCVPVLAPDPEGVRIGTALECACYPLVPFANRAASSRLQGNKRVVRLERNHPTALALHGTGWERPWIVASESTQECRLTLGVSSYEYPFAFEAEQRIIVSESTFMLSMGIHNSGDNSIPVGLGFHPFFPRRPLTSVRFSAELVWMEGGDNLPTHPIPPLGEWDFASWQAIPQNRRNNNYSNWAGLAEIRQPELGYQVSMEASRNLTELMLFVPPNAERFSLEPQSHTSGFTTTQPSHKAARGLIELAPKSVFEISIAIHVSPLQGLS